MTQADVYLRIHSRGNSILPYLQPIRSSNNSQIQEAIKVNMAKLQTLADRLFWIRSVLDADDFVLVEQELSGLNQPEFSQLLGMYMRETKEQNKRIIGIELEEDVFKLYGFLIPSSYKTAPNFLSD